MFPFLRGYSGSAVQARPCVSQPVSVLLPTYDSPERGQLQPIFYTIPLVGENSQPHNGLSAQKRLRELEIVSKGGSGGIVERFIREALQKQPVSGLFGPSGNARTFDRAKAVAMSACREDVQLCGDVVPFQLGIQQHGS